MNYLVSLCFKILLKKVIQITPKTLQDLEFETVLHQKTPNDGKWNLMIGDTVLVQWDGPKRYPFKCNWGGKLVANELVS